MGQVSFGTCCLMRRLGLEGVVCSLRHVLDFVERDWQLPLDPLECFMALRCRVQQGAMLLKAFVKRALQCQQEVGRPAVSLAAEIRELEKAGGIVVARPCVLDSVDSVGWSCHMCGAGFRTKAALHTHKSKRHGILALRSRIAGTMCHGCSREFWATARLRRHIQAAKECAAKYRHADLDLPQQFEVRGEDSSTCWGEGTVDKAAWRPVVVVPTAPPFWATRLPAQQDEDQLNFLEHEGAGGGRAVACEDELRRLLSGDDVPGAAWTLSMLQWISENREGFVTSRSSNKATIAKSYQTTILSHAAESTGSVGGLLIVVRGILHFAQGSELVLENSCVRLDVSNRYGRRRLSLIATITGWGGPPNLTLNRGHLWLWPRPLCRRAVVGAASIWV